VSRLAEWSNGLPYFLEMAAEVVRRCPTARFPVVGDGSLRPELDRQAKRLGIAERVVFTGRVPDVQPFLAAMSVFAMSSLREGGPITVLEAMAMQRPVVATPVGMAPELFDDGQAGVLLPAGDGAALASAVLDLLADPPRAARMAQRGRELVASRFMSMPGCTALRRSTRSYSSRMMKDILVDQCPADGKSGCRCVWSATVLQAPCACAGSFTERLNSLLHCRKCTPDW